jgi:CRP-like cAMP-binding protein
MASPLDNMLLARLDQQLLSMLTGQLSPVTLTTKEPLFDANEPITNVYFPVTSVCSLVSVMNDGKVAEISTIGREGMVGAESMLGIRTLPFRAIDQVPGEAYTLSVSRFRSLLAQEPEFRAYIERYMRAYIVQIGQSAACNSLHDVTRRTARWLLLTHDRAQGDEFQMTQDLLAEMLGVRRATVTQAAVELQRNGFIEYRRGHIRVVDRSRLEGASCECYFIIREAYQAIAAVAV